MSTTATNTRYFFGVGRRKASSARAKITPSDSLSLTVNGRDAKEYFPQHYYLILQNMLHNVGYRQGTINLFINGGGVNSQAEAAIQTKARS